MTIGKKVTFQDIQSESDTNSDLCLGLLGKFFDHYFQCYLDLLCDTYTESADDSFLVDVNDVPVLRGYILLIIKCLICYNRY